MENKTFTGWLLRKLGGRLKAETTQKPKTHEHEWGNWVKDREMKVFSDATNMALNLPTYIQHVQKRACKSCNLSEFKENRI